MARGPDAKGYAPGFSLADQLFNAETVARLGDEYASALPRFDRARFVTEAVAGLEGRALLERLDWLADCVEAQLSRDFNAMANELEAAMPSELDPNRTDDDFGRFIHGVPGILAVRHGLEDHRDRALDLIYEATKRFSMEFYIRPFLNRWPEETLARLDKWADDANYHVRRLVSEGTRPRLPWAKGVSLTPDQTLPLLDKLHADPTRYVTRSVANHLNDITKIAPGRVMERLREWRSERRQNAAELTWMTRHALRNLVKQGDSAALKMLGYRADAPVDVDLQVGTPQVAIGDKVQFSVVLRADRETPVLVDYRIRFATANGRTREKVHKLKQATVPAGKPLRLEKSHPLRGNATTFRLHSGRHGIVVQVNGVDRAEAAFDVVSG